MRNYSRFFYHFPKFHMKSVFNVKVMRENIFKPKIWNENLQQDSNDNRVRTVNFATSKHLVVKTTIFHATRHP
jgi:hypothetical protein